MEHTNDLIFAEILSQIIVETEKYNFNALILTETNTKGKVLRYKWLCTLL